MNDKLKNHYEGRAAIIKAMAHPTRLFIIDELEKGERCVNDLTVMIGSDMSTVSKHLSIMKNAGILGDRREGTTIYYSLKVPCILNFFGCINEVIFSNARISGELVDSCKSKV